MKHISLVRQWPTFVLLTVWSMQVMAQADCSTEIAEIERRIATGKYSDYNVQFAREIQVPLGQTCEFLDEETKASIMDNIEDLLPTKTEEERQAERRAKTIEAKAARQARKQAKADAQRNKPTVSPVILAAPGAKSVATQLYDRNDAMFRILTRDWDLFEGRLRVLYSTVPNVGQYGLPDWTFNVYVAEMTPQGEIAHRLITSKQANDQFGLALRRGYDEVLYHRYIDGPAQDGTVMLERWSISGQRMLSSVDIADIRPGFDIKSWRLTKLQMATSDGNVLFDTISGGNSQQDPDQYAWFKLSPDGRIMGSGTLADMPDGVVRSSRFDTNNGGGGLIVNITPDGNTALVSGLQLSAEEASLGNGLRATVTREKRVLIIDTSADLEFMSIAIERDIMPFPDPDAPPATTTADFLLSLRPRMESLEKRFDANILSTHYLDVGLRMVEMVKSTSNGYAFLTRGPYLIEFDETGETNRIDLKTLTGQMNIQLTTFAPAPNGRFYVHGERGADSHIILIDAEGNPLARAQTTNTPGAVIEGIMADDGGVWMYGHAYQENNVGRIWIERFDF